MTAPAEFRVPFNQPVWWCVVRPVMPDPVRVRHTRWFEARKLAERELAKRGVKELGYKPELVWYDEATKEWR